MTRRKLQQFAKTFLDEMGYKVREWTAYRNHWMFGFVGKGKDDYGCIVFAVTGRVCIEILDQKEYKTFDI